MAGVCHLAVVPGAQSIGFAIPVNKVVQMLEAQQTHTETAR